VTVLLDRAFKTAQTLSPELQDEIAQLVLQYVGEEQPVYLLSTQDEAAIATSRAAAHRGEFATASDMQTVRARVRS
jgi:ABC-type thiamine transport system ATPase subunit